MNKRKALIGWIVYTVGKPIAMRVMKRKAKEAVPVKKSRSRWAVTTGIAAGLAAVGGAVFFWRKKSDGGEAPPAES